MQRTLESAERTISRRLFLKTGAAIGGGLMIGWVPEAHAADAAKKAEPSSSRRATYASIRKAR